MKYNININQLVLSKTNLDLIDCAIIDYIYYYCNSKNEKIESQRIKNEKGIWTWINYQTLLGDMPLIKIKSSGALTPRIKKIEQEGYIETFRQGNQKLFIKLNSKIDELFIETNRAVHENEQSCSPERTNNNTINNYTKNIEYIFEYWNKQKIIVHSKLTDKIKTKIKSALKDYKKDQIFLAIRKYKMVLAGPEYFWTYQWSLDKFLHRGLTDFVDSPIDKWKKSNGFEKPKKRKVYFNGDPVVKKNGKQWVIQNGDWREFVGDEKELVIKFE